MKIKILSILLLIATSMQSFAQNKTISGKVTDSEQNLPLPGVSVTISGTNNSVQTDANGNYSIAVPAEAKSLTFSFIGFISKVVAVDRQTVINVSLDTDTKQLSEVVVVAYGTQKKEAITGSISTIDAKALDNRVITNISNILQGAAPGIVTNSGNGQPGVSSAVRIRGFGSISASSAPLYVLDGAVYDGNIADISPNDIESVSILKDATSSALYGARAGNGVIIITTKKGKLGEPQLSVNFNQGFSKRGIPEYDRVGTLDYYPAMWQALKNSLVYPRSGTALSESAAATQASNTIQSQLIYNPFNVANNQIVGTDGKLNSSASLLYNDFDWYAPLERTGERSDFNFSIGGKNNKSDYFLSLGYLADNGYIKASDYTRYNGRLNVNSQVKPWLKAGLNLAGTFSNGNTIQDASTGSATSFINIFNFARGIGPIYPVRAYNATGQPVLDANGNQYYDYGIHPGSVNRPQGANAGRNVVIETLLNERLNKRVALNTRSFLEVKFLKDFTFKPSISMDLRNADNNNYGNPTVGDGVTRNGTKFSSSSLTRSYTFNQLLTYNKAIGNHTFSALAAHENYDLDFRTVNVSKQGQILDGNTELDNFVSVYDGNGHQDTYRIESYFTKLSYNFNEKYFVDGSFRRDGSSRFATESRWGSFFSVGGSWAIHKENFMEQASWVNDLRLKASYGEVGNDDLLDPNANSQYYNYQAFYDLGWNNGAEPGILLATNATPDLRWETVNTLNTGVAFSLFKNRLYGELELYRRGSKDLLFSVPQPLSDPVTSIRKNIGIMYNKGIDLQLGGDVVRSKDFNWSVVTNWSVVKNKITKLPAETPVITNGTKRLEVGRDIYAYYLRQWVGVDPADGSALYVPAEGTTTDLRTIDGKTYTVNFNNAKFDYSGSAIPDLYGSVGSTFGYKAFSLSFLVNYQIGGKFYDSVYQGLMSVNYGSALHADALNSWTTPGQVTDIPRLDIASTTFFNATSNRWLVDASYLSFRNVNLSYQLPKDLLKRIQVNNARLFVTGENLGLITKRKGLNPTEAFTGLNDNTYTPSRTISFGLNLNF